MEISSIVDKIKRKYKTNSPQEIAEHMGILIVTTKLGSKTKGFYLYRKRCHVIFLNENLNERERDMVLAHELGHAIMHKGENAIFLRANTFFSVNKLEIEANAFAMLLLISDDSLREYITYGYTIDNLASVYGYDKALIELRLKYFEM